MNKILFFGKAVVPTFYPFTHFSKQFGLKQIFSSSKSPNGIKVIFRNLHHVSLHHVNLVLNA
ncbi:hypothetical protein LEP1GSC099_2661 [Leptospira interrogans str. UI 08452]|uniref:Uncharacterized protein n=2 Tax=Leptospira interrogans TaxID=173 RepID=A0A0F6HEE0_LEPIR|nr:hypothetical protein LEP1GSC104_3460 [Leptospira interrogans str. UI 12621]EKR84721.1 hypothetical protein LEP1GSC099_2661 [Leptospira interrogans str. UI 08452]EMM80844.1 hypothetical protein LEP1GSC037_0257 [Leptospira interrogans str. 2006001854]